MAFSIFTLIFLCALVFSAAADFSERLLFVGEDVAILTLASKHPELPLEAPAISQVITAEEIKKGGFRTLAELLRTIPGLFIEQREGEVRPYFRGVPEGFLLLYDGVPFTSDSTKAIYSLAEEISLEALARVEIVRGPGSVLWGPDAFAGLINLVPKKGGHPTFTLLTGSPLKDFSTNFFLPFKKGLFKGALNFYYYGRDERKERFSFPGGAGQIGRAEFFEFLFNLNRGSAFRLSARFSHPRRPFIMQGVEGFSWPGLKENPVSFLKIETGKQWAGFTLRSTFYYQYLFRREKEIFLTEKQKNHLLYGEILLDKPFWHRKSLITLGVSWRKNYVRDATVNVRGYLPEFLKEPNRQFRPLVDTADFDTDLYSAFFQVRYKFSRGDFWIGGRFSDHDHYESVFSRQAGLLWRLPHSFYLKISYGTSFRTPYSAQFLGYQQVKKPEKMRSLSLELLYKPSQHFSFYLSPFYNRISHHLAEDPFGGYSEPLKQYFLGTEIGFSWQRKFFSLKGEYTFFNNWGEKEKYRVIDYIIIRPGRPPLYHYSYYERPFSRGPRHFGHLDLTLNPFKNLFLFSRLSFIGKRTFYHLKTGAKEELASKVLLDLTARYQKNKLGLELSLKNAFDAHYYTAGKFSPVCGQRFGLFFRISYSW